MHHFSFINFERLAAAASAAVETLLQILSSLAHNATGPDLVQALQNSFAPSPSGSQGSQGGSTDLQVVNGYVKP